jgi:hypothetical protein
VVGAATTVKDTLVDAGHRAAPVLQKAATVAGQVARSAASFAQPIVHGVAVAIAEVTAGGQQAPTQEKLADTSNITNTTDTGDENASSADAEESAPNTSNTTTSSQDSVYSSPSPAQPEKKLSSKQLPTSTTSSPSIEKEKDKAFTSDTDFKDKQEKEKRPSKSSPAPMLAGEFRKAPASTTEEVKSRPSSPHLQPMPSPSPESSSTMSTNPITASATTTAPLGSVPTVMLVLPDAANNQGFNKDQQTGNFDGTQKGLVPSRSNDELPTTNYQIDIQVKQKTNLNTNTNLQQSTESQ